MTRAQRGVLLRFYGAAMKLISMRSSDDNSISAVYLFVSTIIARRQTTKSLHRSVRSVQSPLQNATLDNTQVRNGCLPETFKEPLLRRLLTIRAYKTNPSPMC